MPTLVCSGHRLNSAVQWATGSGGPYKKDGSGTCKNREVRELVSKSTLMLGHLGHSVCKKDELKAAQAEEERVATQLEIIRPNDTRCERFCLGVQKCTRHLPR